MGKGRATPPHPVTKPNGSRSPGTGNQGLPRRRILATTRSISRGDVGCSRTSSERTSTAWRTTARATSSPRPQRRRRRQGRQGSEHTAFWRCRMIKQTSLARPRNSTLRWRDPEPGMQSPARPVRRLLPTTTTPTAAGPETRTIDPRAVAQSHDMPAHKLGRRQQRTLPSGARCPKNAPVRSGHVATKLSPAAARSPTATPTQNTRSCLLYKLNSRAKFNGYIFHMSSQQDRHSKIRLPSSLPRSGHPKGTVPKHGVRPAMK